LLKAITVSETFDLVDSTELTSKILNQEKLLFEDGIKKVESNNVLIPEYDIESKLSHDLTKYRSFIQLLTDFGIDPMIYVKDKDEIVEDCIETKIDETQYNNFVAKFKEFCYDNGDKWNYHIVLKTFPKLKMFIDLLARKINQEEIKKRPFKNIPDDKIKGKSDGKQNISMLSSVRSDNGKDNSKMLDEKMDFLNL
jgi:hypothetical protein